MKHEQQLTAMLIPFYSGQQAAPEGQNIQTIWAWDFEQLEDSHNYIQWLFPLAEKSAFNLNAPVVDEVVIQAFRSNPHLRKNLRQSLRVMLRFYGLQYVESKDDRVVVNQLASYSERKPNWVSKFNHNHLRITRILKCLMILGLENYARAFYACLQQIYQEDSGLIGEETFQYWTRAINTNTSAYPTCTLDVADVPRATKPLP
jgi:hypothetical protein